MTKRKTKQPSFECDTNGSIMVTCALRYALGRHTYVPGAVQDWIVNNWDSLDYKTRFLIIRDTFEHLYEEYTNNQRDNGIKFVLDDYDLKSWETFSINRYLTLDYNQRKEIDFNFTSPKNRYKEWFQNIMIEKLYFKSQKKRLEALQKLSDLDQELGLQ